jgi:hypothetical protein
VLDTDIVGVRLRDTGDALEESFAILDKQMMDAEAKHKVYSLSVSYGIFSDPTAYAQADYVTEEAGKVPVPWDPKWQSYLSQRIKALSVHLRNRRVSYILATGFQINVESFLGQEVDRPNWEAKAHQYGYTDALTAWQDAARKIFALWVQGFPNVPVLLTAQSPFPGEEKAVNSLKQWIVATYPQNGWGIAYLHAVLPPYPDPVNVTYAKFNQAAVPSMHKGVLNPRFYLVQPATLPSAEQRLRDLVAGARVKGGHVVEVYKGDLLNAKGIIAELNGEL